MKDEQLDKLFKDNLSELDIKADADSWEKIAADLDRDQKIVPLWRKSWVRYAAAVLLLAGIGTWAIQYSTEEQSVGQQPIASVSEDTSVTMLPQQDTPDAITAEQPAPVSNEQATHRLATSAPRQEHLKEETVLSQAFEKSVDRKIIAQLPELKAATLTAVAARGFNQEKLGTHQVVEIDPIQPLIENPEEEETMLAARPSSGPGLVPGLLNKISEVVNPDDHKTIHFSNDEEGSLRIDIFNSLVKNRTRKRK